MERHSFRIVSGESQICAFRQNFYTRKLGEITVFYTVLNRTLVFYRLAKLKKALEIGFSIKPFSGNPTIWSNTLKHAVADELFESV